MSSGERPDADAPAAAEVLPLQVEVDDEQAPRPAADAQVPPASGAAGVLGDVDGDGDVDQDDYDAYGAEAAPPPGEYQPYAASMDKRAQMWSLGRRSEDDELRELERRLRAQLSAADPIEERRKLPLEFLWKRWREFAMQGRSEAVDEFGRDPVFAGKIDTLLEFLYSKYFRVSVQGLENIPADGRALLVANHSGSLPYDGAMLMHAVKRDHAQHRSVRPLVEDFVFHFPYLGTFMSRIGGVRACQENAERLLQQGECVAVFPEGIKGIGKLYRERYRLQRFGRGGFVKLALRTDAPIIPCAIVGAEEIHPMLTKLTWLTRSLGIPYVPITPTFPLLGPLGLVPLPTKWTLRIGKPLRYHAEFGRAAADDRILVNRLSENVRGKIQEMIDEVLVRRKSVLFG
ncbi:MAG: acyltransferase family protein [Deltaproteobacteria bacterium]|nr:acyltransferase family protein [Deltaproteobacteria bacterium]